MAVARDYHCTNPSCEKKDQVFEHFTAVDEIVSCSGCGWTATALPVATKSYTIQGDNSASITPKRHRKP